MRTTWISASAAAWTFGGLAAVLGFALSPVPTDVPLGTAALVASQHDSRWVVSIFLLFASAIGMCFGVRAIGFLLRDASGFIAWNTAIAYIVGSVGMGGQAMMLAFVRALVNADRSNTYVLDVISADLVLNVLLLTWSAGLFAGLLLLAVGLWRADATPRWIPAAFLAFVVSQFLNLPGGMVVDTLQFALLAVCIAGASFCVHQQTRQLDAVEAAQLSTSVRVAPDPIARH
ncbi:hypothetical protein [Paenarthrobacter sp. C1]|uniref:hypothetical protein n=1 Tax=Paenarthrobacter sp. C1 TaxID=3400220 RepID=UPI003BF4612C